MRKKSPKVIATRSLVSILSIFIGILIVSQINTLPSRVTNPIAPYATLKETREDLYLEQEELQSEIKSLQEQIRLIQGDTEESIVPKSEMALLNLKKAQAGLAEISGPGVVITLNDSKSGQASEDSIIHAADLRDILNLLWGSGAEAISINDRRVVVNTAVDCIVNTILINNSRISNPFEIKAVGNQVLMNERLKNPNLLTSLYQRKKQYGIEFEVKEKNTVQVPMFDGSFDPLASLN